MAQIFGVVVAAIGSELDWLEEGAVKHAAEVVLKALEDEGLEIVPRDCGCGVRVQRLADEARQMGKDPVVGEVLDRIGDYLSRRCPVQARPTAKGGM
jgi:hypothetical protein